MNPYNNLLKQLEDLQTDFDKFYNSRNKAAGTRVRVGLQKLTKEIKQVRKEIQAIKNR